MDLFYFAAIHQWGHADAANRHVSEVCNGLARRGHRIFLFVPKSRSSNAVLHPDVRLVCVPVLRGHLLLVTFSFHVLVIIWAWQYLRQAQAPIVYLRASFLDFITLAPLRLFFDVTFVAELNGIRSLETGSNSLKRSLIDRMERLSLCYYDRVIGVTAELRRWAMQTGCLRPEEATAIGNGVPVELFRPIPIDEAKCSLGLDADVHYLNFTGSLKPWHGARLLIQAMVPVLSDFPCAVRLLIVGDGPERAELEELASRLGVAQVIDWVGQVPIDEVPTYISASHICLAPFSLERNAQTGISPLKVFEYMACGRPFVTTGTGTSYDDWVRDCACGILAPPNDASALGQAIIQLLRDPEQGECLGRQGRRLAVERHSWDKISECIEQFIWPSLFTSSGPRAFS